MKNYYIFLNSDILLNTAFTVNMISYMEKNTSVGIAGPVLFYPDGTVNSAGGKISRSGFGNDINVMPTSTLNMMYICSAACVVRSKMIEQIGGLS